MKQFFRRIAALVLVFAVSIGVLGTDVSASVTSKDAYDAIMALQDEYPEGMTWTNSNGPYIWQPMPYYYLYSYGCAAFALICSDAAFGDVSGEYPVRGYAVTSSLPGYVQSCSDSFSYEKLRAGDIVRLYNDSHSVVILERYDDYVVVCEGNFNNSIHWGRAISKDEIMMASYVLTRYPENYLPAVITAQPSSVTAEKGSTAVFAVSASNATAYRWQYNDGSGWANIPENFTGYNTDMLQLKALTSRNGWKFRCKIKGQDGSWIRSNTAILKVTAPAVITAQPESITAEKGSTVRFTVAASDAAAYRWQYNDGSGWTDVPDNFTGYHSKTLKLKAVISRNGWKFRCKIKGYDGVWIKSDTVRLKVTAPAVITAQPESITAEKGSTVRFTVTASDAAAYRWQYNDGSGWADVPDNFTGYHSRTLKLKAVSSRNGWRFRCKIKGYDGVWIKSNTVRLTIN